MPGVTHLVHFPPSLEGERRRASFNPSGAFVGVHRTRKLVSTYLPAELHRWLKTKAALEGTTISALLERAVRLAFASDAGVLHLPAMTEVDKSK